ncbi:MAG: glycine zipper 2TM domain-containing protein [Zoogloeaceae bacterium]|jgi:uncharacterized protein YcfJ|nr:glycine zipper 2TM domain-containing protein [Zoogloeaceae bacterium]
MKRISLLFSLLLCVAFSGVAAADQRHSWRASSAQPGHFTQRTLDHRRPVRSSPTVIYRSAPTAVVYRSAPVVVYQEPVVIYREPAVVYREPAVVHEEDAPSGEARANDTAARVVGAIAGGVIGSRFGGGNGRLAATAAGAVLGSIIAGELAR